MFSCCRVFRLSQWRPDLACPWAAVSFAVDRRQNPLTRCIPQGVCVWGRGWIFFSGAPAGSTSFDIDVHQAPTWHPLWLLGSTPPGFDTKVSVSTKTALCSLPPLAGTTRVNSTRALPRNRPEKKCAKETDEVNRMPTMTSRISRQLRRQKPGTRWTAVVAATTVEERSGTGSTASAGETLEATRRTGEGESGPSWNVFRVFVLRRSTQIGLLALALPKPDLKNSPPLEGKGSIPRATTTVTIWRQRQRQRQRHRQPEQHQLPVVYTA